MSHKTVPTAFVLMLSLCIGCGREAPKDPANDGVNAPVTDADPAETDFPTTPTISVEPAVDGLPENLEELDSATFAQEFEDDEGAASAKYNSKWVKLKSKFSMPVLDPGLNQGGNVVLTGTAGRGIECHFDAKDIDKVRNSSVTREVTVVGKFQRAGIIYVNLEPAHVVELGNDPAVDVTMAELVDAYAKATAEEPCRFAEKPIRFQGELTAIDDKDGCTFKSVTTGEGKEITVTVGIPPLHTKYLKRYKVGDVVVAQGIGRSSLVGTKITIFSGQIVGKAEAP